MAEKVFLGFAFDIIPLIRCVSLMDAVFSSAPIIWLPDGPVSRLYRRSIGEFKPILSGDVMDADPKIGKAPSVAADKIAVGAGFLHRQMSAFVPTHSLGFVPRDRRRVHLVKEAV